MNPLIGVYGLKQLGIQVTTVDRQELLGQEITPEQQAQMSVPKTPVVWPKTSHTQISLLKPCFAVKPLHLAPLQHGKIQMEAHSRTEKGAYMFVPSKIGEEAGLSMSAISVNKHGKFRVPVKNISDQAPIKVDIGSTIGTIGHATILSVDQLQTKMWEKEEHYQQKLDASLRLQ
ncbi:MAG: hypothetical protein GY820_46175, partial [Gammaproteobacteria bacterium]|nr:hypothetical protein [Gammaproteobacteria bacterium]